MVFTRFPPRRKEKSLEIANMPGTHSPVREIYASIPPADALGGRIQGDYPLNPCGERVMAADSPRV